MYMGILGAGVIHCDLKSKYEVMIALKDKHKQQSISSISKETFQVFALMKISRVQDGNFKNLF